jgi:uridylate kinase
LPIDKKHRQGLYFPHKIMSDRATKYRRILLKLSGEALAGNSESALDPAICSAIAHEIAEVRGCGVEIGIVIGGGNIMRGASAKDIERTTADTMGMLATTINSFGLQSYLEQAGCPAKVLTAVGIEGAGERFSADKAKEYLSLGIVVLIAGGTGNPFFTTDTAAALRAAEIGAEVLFKATKVDGIYDSDPVNNPAAKKITALTHAEALAKKLKVMDATAFSFCMENNIPIIVFKVSEAGNLRACVEGRPIGSIVTTGG